MAAWHTRVVSFVRDLFARLRRHNLTLIAAGAAFYGFLALIPSLIAFVSVYGLVSDPADVRQQVKSVAGALPDEVERFLEFQLKSITAAGSAELSITLVIALVLALWSASGGVAALVHGILVAHEETRGSSFVRRRARALGLTVGAIVLLVLVGTITAVLPSLVDDVVGGFGLSVVTALRWPALAVLMVLGLGLLYRFADPHRGHGWLGFLTKGAVVGTLLWLVGSYLFSLYTARFAGYADTYGSIAVIVVLLLWLFLASFAVLVGAEVDSMD